MADEKPRGLLSMVGTPIGNLSDLSERQVACLSSADAILCEDTRVTARLLAHLAIRRPLVRCDENVIARRTAEVLRRLGEGEHLAFVSDAGMPGLSDPGQHLVDAALDAGLAVEVIPGPSACLCALVASGLPMDHFFFEGFLPRKASARLRRLAELVCIPGALVIFESPHRVVDTLAAIAEVMATRKVALVRELTKVHEECRRGAAPDLARELAAERDRGQEPRGECVIVVAGPDASELERHARESQAPCETPHRMAARLVAEGLAPSKVARELHRALGIPRDQAYDLARTQTRDAAD